jgi:hypothetical protein
VENGVRGRALVMLTGALTGLVEAAFLAAGLAAVTAEGVYGTPALPCGSAW